MAQRFISIVNRVNNAAIRRIKNERGDLVYVVPSYTLPDNCVMNGGLYPSEEIEAGYKSLEGTPAPAAHPMDAQGNYISANSEDGVLYYQCGIFNKNVQRVQDDRYGYRVYVEKHIHVETAMQTERGRAIIDAIDRGQPIHTSTGVMVNQEMREGVSNGKNYSWVATNLEFDHDAILLNEEGAATPDDGVGMLINKQLVNSMSREGKSFAVNSASPEVNQSFNDLRETLQTKLQKKYGDDETHVWLNDFGDDYVVFESKEASYMASYMKDDQGNVMIGDELQEVKRRTIWEAVTSAIKKTLTSPFVGLNSNQEGNDMFKQHIESVLKANNIDTANMDDAALLDAFKALQANTAESAEGGQSQPEGLSLEAVQSLIDQAMQANAQKQANADKAKLVAELKANGVDLPQADADSMTVNALQIMLANAAKPAYGLGGGYLKANAQDDADYSDTLPE